LTMWSKGKTIMADEPASEIAAEHVEPKSEASLADLKKASQDLKQRIIDEKRKHDMPVNASLGDPNIDADNADGHNDLPDSDDD